MPTLIRQVPNDVTVANYLEAGCRLLIFDERHLRRVLTSYSLYYNKTRTQLGLAKDAATTSRPAIWHHHHHTNLVRIVRIASSLCADIIFGKDSTFPARAIQVDSSDLGPRSLSGRIETAPGHPPTRSTLININGALVHERLAERDAPAELHSATVITTYRSHIKLPRLPCALPCMYRAGGFL